MRIQRVNSYVRKTDNKSMLAITLEGGKVIFISQAQWNNWCKGTDSATAAGMPVMVSYHPVGHELADGSKVTSAETIVADLNVLTNETAIKTEAIAIAYEKSIGVSGLDKNPLKKRQEASEPA